MAYVDGFVVAVPAQRKDEYRAHADKFAAVLREFGATRVVEAWGDDVPDGKLTDFKRAVQAKDGEVIVFSWVEYPSKAVRDEAQKRMMSDPRMENAMSDMPFDGKRMIFGGFEMLLDRR